MNNKTILIIMDGFGISCLSEGNAVLAAKTPVFDTLIKNYPKTLLHASGEEVGLPWGEMGNSEVGHLNLGTGRITQQDLPRINSTIIDKTFFANSFLLSACEHAKKNKSTLHLLGLLSNGGVHADIKHLLALIKLCNEQKIQKLAIHLITDGRDMPKQSCLKLIDKVNEQIKLYGGKITSIVGRYWAMDRDSNWERTQKAYNLLTAGIGQKYSDPKLAINDRYKKGEDDEKISPIILDESLCVSDNDAVIFFNFRPDRAKQLTNVFIDNDFNSFKRNKFIKNLRFITFTSYGNEQSPLIDVAYMAQKTNHQLAQIISDNKLKQLHAAETEKYAHVTYFFNGGEEKQYDGENRILVPSPKVDSYDKVPQMSARILTNKFLDNWKNDVSFGVINFANPDMVGHTGNMNATVKAIEYMDDCIGRIISNIPIDTSILITADHGNAEIMIDLNKRTVDKQHSVSPVPFIYVENNSQFMSKMKNQATHEEKLLYFAQSPCAVLADISPTIISILGIEKPDAMTGINLKEII